jgi:hypothetical protein
MIDVLWKEFRWCLVRQMVTQKVMETNVGVSMVKWVITYFVCLTP